MISLFSLVLVTIGKYVFGIYSKGIWAVLSK